MSRKSSRSRITVTCPNCGTVGPGPTKGMMNRVSSSGLFFARDNIKLTCPYCGYTWTFGSAEDFFNFKDDSAFTIAIKILFLIIFLTLFFYICSPILF